MDKLGPLKRNQRDKRLKNPTPIRLTHRDIEIIKAVHEYRVLTTQQLKALFFPSMHQAYNRLQALYNHQFIDRRFQGVATDKMNTPILYVLDIRGAELLRSELGLDVEWHPSQNQVSVQFLEHMMAISEVRIAISLNCRQMSELELLHWSGEADMKAGYDRVTIRLDTGKQKYVSLIPDSYFILSTPHGKSHCFLELDRGTMTVKRFKEKGFAYQQYYKSGIYQERYQTRSLRILTVTSSQNRAKNLLQAMNDLDGKQRFWFTTLEQVQNEPVLTAPIWQTPDKVELRCLIELAED